MSIMNPAIAVEVQNIIFTEAILTIASELKIKELNEKRARASMMTVCSTSVFEVYPVPYGKYIKMSIGISNSFWFNDHQLDVATHFLIIHCSDPRKVTSSQYGKIYDSIKSGDVDKIKSSIENLNDKLNSKVKNWGGNDDDE